MTENLSYGHLLQLQRLTTPTIYNGWEQITQHDRREHTNIEETRDYMPHMGPMVGYAITVVCQPSNPDHATDNPDAWARYRDYVASMPSPKIVVVKDLDKPHFIGAFWGEVNASIHRALGCIGTITDGAIRDIDEMNSVGFKALAARLCVGHAFSVPVRWNCEVEVFGCKVAPGQLIHADQHGFLVVPQEDESRLLEASQFMDTNECHTVIEAGRNAHGKSMDEILKSMERATHDFNAAARQRFGKTGEW
jgi:4-hydroxy-4-methyl-2-oxoglutarate aldolase